MRITLYTTSGCHLCEMAEQLLRAQCPPYEAVEIADSDALVERYGVRIPVLREEASGSELGWPFDAARLECWLRGLQNS